MGSVMKIKYGAHIRDLSEKVQKERRRCAISEPQSNKLSPQSIQGIPVQTDQHGFPKADIQRTLASQLPPPPPSESSSSSSSSESLTMNPRTIHKSLRVILATDVDSEGSGRSTPCSSSSRTSTALTTITIPDEGKWTTSDRDSERHIILPALSQPLVTIPTANVSLNRRTYTRHTRSSASKLQQEDQIPAGPIHLEHNNNIARNNFKTAVLVALAKHYTLGQLRYAVTHGSNHLDRELIRSCSEVQRTGKILNETDALLEEAVARGELWENTPIPPQYRLENFDIKFLKAARTEPPTSFRSEKEPRKTSTNLSTAPEHPGTATEGTAIEDVTELDNQANSGDPDGEKEEQTATSEIVSAVTSPDDKPAKRPRGRPRKRTFDDGEQISAPSATPEAPVPLRQSKRLRRTTPKALR